jgi:NTE family protein
MRKRINRSAIPKHRQTALVLQGGGALGAYQAGVYQDLAGTPYEPNWVAGVSIGAINAALIAGNAPENRVGRLHQFWERVSSGVNLPVPHIDSSRAAFNQLSAAYTATVGVPGFFRPTMPSMFALLGQDRRLSVYDTEPLRETLEEMIDFDLINSKQVRLSVGAVSVTTGNSIYFDNFLHPIGPEHIMASGALPPAFPPVTIDGEAYWDGGIVSNTPLQYVLDARGNDDLLAFSVDLFSARGELPVDLASVMARQKDIQYSSRTRYNTDTVAKIQNTRQAARDLLLALPPRIRSNPGIAELQKLLSTPKVDIVHLIYRQRAYEHGSKDFEFSRASVNEHWDAGACDIRDTLVHPEWLRRSGLDDGVTMFDLHRPAKATT